MGPVEGGHQRLPPIFRHVDVRIGKDDHLTLGLQQAAIARASNAQRFARLNQRDIRLRLGKQEVGAAICRTVVHHNDFAIGRQGLGKLLDRALQQHRFVGGGQHNAQIGGVIATEKLGGCFGGQWFRRRNDEKGRGKFRFFFAQFGFARLQKLLHQCHIILPPARVEFDVPLWFQAPVGPIFYKVRNLLQKIRLAKRAGMVRAGTAPAIDIIDILGA